MNQNQSVAKYHLLFTKESSAGGCIWEMFVQMGNEETLLLDVIILSTGLKCYAIKACFFKKSETFQKFVVNLSWVIKWGAVLTHLPTFVY